MDTWVDWVKRVTHKAQEKLKDANMDTWISIIKRQKWRFAKRVATAQEERWTRKIINWDPESHYDKETHKGKRKQARPKKRWLDDIMSFVKKQTLDDQAD